jgi:hypothetical protein
MDRPSDIAAVYVYVVWYVPFQLLYPHFAPDGGLGALPLQMLHFGGLAFFQWVRRQRLYSIQIWNVSASNVLFLFALLTLACVAVIGMTTSLVFDFSFEHVYDQRMRARDQFVPNGLAAYTFTLLQYGFCPVLLVLAARRKAWSIFAVGVLGTIVTFAAAGTKSSLFLMPLLIFGVLLGRRWVAGRSGLSLLPFVLTLCIAASLFTYSAFDDTWLTTLFAERLLAGRVHLSAKAFEYFTESPFFYFTDMNGIGPIISGFLGLPHGEQGRGFVLGRFIFGERSECNANLVAWSSTYADIGAIGFFVASLFGGMLMRIVDSIAIRGDRISCTAICLMYAFLLCETSLPGFVLGGGLIISLPALWLTTQGDGAATREKVTAAVPRNANGCTVFPRLRLGAGGDE